jgi:hypothetical protein
MILLALIYTIGYITVQEIRSHDERMKAQGFVRVGRHKQQRVRLW